MVKDRCHPSARLLQVWEAVFFLRLRRLRRHVWPISLWFSHWFNQPTISNSHVIKKNSGKLGAPLYKLGIDMCFMLNTKQCAADWGLFKTEGLHRFFCQRKRFPKRRLSSIILQCFKSHSLWACLIHLRQAWKRKSPCSFSSIARAHLQIFDWSQVSQVPCSCFFQVGDYQRFQ